MPEEKHGFPSLVAEVLERSNLKAVEVRDMLRKSFMVSRVWKSRRRRTDPNPHADRARYITYMQPVCTGILPNARAEAAVQRKF